MNRPSSALCSPLILLLAVAPHTLGSPAAAQTVTKRVGSVTFVVDQTLGFPGGFFVVRLQSRVGLGTAWAILDGRRAPFSSAGRGPRALVPVPVGTAPGPNVIGVEIAARRGRQRVPVNVTVSEKSYPPRLVHIPEARRPLLLGREAGHDGRLLLGLVRTQTMNLVPRGPLRDPVIAPSSGFGSAQTYEGGDNLESLLDSTWGEVHRGLDYEVPAGTLVASPAAGTVLFAGPLLLSGQTVVIDHGQGVVSVLLHLSRLDVTLGQSLEAAARVGLSGDSGVCAAPLLQWRVYLNGTAVDPRLLDHPLD